VTYTLREARTDDYESLAALAAASADTGRIRVALRYRQNPVDALAALKPDVQWVVAEGEDGLIGCGQLIPYEAEIEDEPRSCAVLGNLMVHPAHRRRGVATALTQWRLERAGPDTVVVAGIQSGNEGSLANARKWATQIFGTLLLPAFGVEAGAVPPEGPEIREPRDDPEWDEAAEGLAAFQRGWNLRAVRDGAALRERAGRAFQGERLQRYFVAVERDQVVGGFELFEGSRLDSLVFEHLPLALRVVNLVVRVLPRDGELRANALSAFWYAPGREDAGRSLWASARSLAAQSGNAIGLQFDPRGPLGALVRARPWTPKGQLTVAVRSPVPLNEERLLAAP
jgi:GNAT superfamily N-acetyltransferase